MDPNETLSDLIESLREGEFEVARERLEDLISWLENGGFPPQWEI